MRGLVVRCGRAALVALALGAGLFSLGPVLPVPRGLDGATFCYPFVGAVVRLDPRLPAAARRFAAAHEQVHAMQCDSLGALERWRRQMTTAGRLALEAEAFCGQGRAEVAAGAPVRLVTPRLAEELGETGLWFRGVPPGQVAQALALACPDLARGAADEERQRESERQWQSERQRRHGSATIPPT